MRILYIAQRVPYPPDRGDKIATYNQILYLSQRHEVVVACLADGEEDLNNVAPLAAVAAAVDAVPVRKWAARLRAIVAVATGQPFTKAYFNERELHRRIAARVAGKKFDVIVVYSSGVAQFAEEFRSIPRIIQFGDLDSLKWEQYSEKSSFPVSWLYGREHQLLLEYERHLAKTFNHSLVCTMAELRDFKRLIPGVPASCVGNGVDLDYFKTTHDRRIPNRLIFTGVMDYFPNVEGVIWFCHDVLPLMRKEIPGVTLTICGSRPGPDVLALNKLPGVEVTGRVPDVRPYMEQASLCVVPLRIARGIQNKLLEAMAMGLPVVTCSASFSGIEAIPGQDLEVADDAVGFASAAVRLLRDPDRRQRMARAARRCVEERYTWQRQLERMEDVLRSVST